MLTTLLLAALSPVAVEVAVAIDKPKPAVGERVVATYTATVPEGTSLTIDTLVSPKPTEGDAAVSGMAFEFEPVAPPAIEKTSTPGTVLWKQQIAFASFAAGSLPVPGPHINVTSKDGAKTTVRAAATRIEVSSRIPEGQKPEELAIKTDRGVRLPARSAWFWGGLAALVLLLAFAVWALFRKKKAPAVEAAPVPKLSPAEELDESLERLAREADVLGEDSRDFYSYLTHAVKRYLERRLDMPVLEWTTFETLRRLRDAGWDMPREVGLSELLSGADRVKFGRGRSTRQEARENLDRARKLRDALEAQHLARVARLPGAVAREAAAPPVIRKEKAL